MFAENRTENETSRIVAAFELHEARRCCPQMEDGMCCSPDGKCSSAEWKRSCLAIPPEALYTIMSTNYRGS